MGADWVIVVRISPQKGGGAKDPSQTGFNDKSTAKKELMRETKPYSICLS